MADDSKLLIERGQTRVRIEKRILKVLKAFAEYHDMTLGDVLEGIVLHAFDGKTPFSAASLERIEELKRFYELDLDSGASHRLKEIKAKATRKNRKLSVFTGPTKHDERRGRPVLRKLRPASRLLPPRRPRAPGFRLSVSI